MSKIAPQKSPDTEEGNTLEFLAELQAEAEEAEAAMASHEAQAQRLEAQLDSMSDGPEKMKTKKMARCVTPPPSPDVVHQREPLTMTPCVLLLQAGAFEGQREPKASRRPVGAIPRSEA